MVIWLATARAARRLGRRWRVYLAGATVMTLAIALAVTAIAVGGAILRPLPFTAAERLVLVGGVTFPEGTNTARWFGESPALEVVATYRNGRVVLAGGATARLVAGMEVSTDFFPLLGVRPVRGRWLAPAGSGSVPEAVISERTWRSQFGSSASILGEAILLGVQPYVVTGVMPDRFTFPLATDVWLLTRHDEANRNVSLRAGFADVPAQLQFGLLARLRRDVSAGTALDAVTELQRRLEVAGGGPVGSTVSVHRVQELLTRDVRRDLYVVAVCVLILLLVASLGMAAFISADIVDRGGEFRQFIALGATFPLLAWELVVEFAVVVISTSVAGVVAAYWSTSVAARMVPYWALVNDVAVDRLVLGIVLAGMAVLTVVAVAGPLLQLRRVLRHTTLASGLRGPGRSSGGWDHALLSMQVAGTIALTYAAGLMARSMGEELDVDPGFVATGVVAQPVTLDESMDAVDRESTWSNILNQINVGGTRAGLVDVAPMTRRVLRRFWVETPLGGNFAVVSPVSPDYFDVLGIRFLAGGPFVRSSAAAGVAVVSRSMSETIADGLALGGRIEIDGRRFAVVGVVDDVHATRLVDAPVAHVYVPYWQSRPIPDTMTVVAAGVDREAFAESVRKATLAYDSAAAVEAEEAVRLAEVVEASTRTDRIKARGIQVLAVITLLTGLVATWAVAASRLERRRAEMRIRVALGASMGHLYGLTVMTGVRFTAVGLLLSAPLVFWLGRGLGTSLFNVGAYDPIAAVGAVGLTVVGTTVGLLIACRGLFPPGSFDQALSDVD